MSDQRIIKLTQIWIAKSCVGASTVRNQIGPKKKVEDEKKNKPGLKKPIIKFLEGIDLSQIGNLDKEQDNESRYFDYLDEQTRTLQNELIDSLHEVLRSDPELRDQKYRFWGISRKCLNIFFIRALHDKYLSKEFGLENIENYLELPLDNPNIDKLGYKGSFKIRTLNPELSLKLQKLATNEASARGLKRYQLDLEWYGKKAD